VHNNFAKRRGYFGVVRVNKMDRDVFGSGCAIDEEFRGARYVKAIRDNCTETSLKTHPLLANLRSLIGEERIRNITGRPRRPPERRPEQLELAFPDAA
jgi:hypothetical protein